MDHTDIYLKMKENTWKEIENQAKRVLKKNKKIITTYNKIFSHEGVKNLT